MNLVVHKELKYDFLFVAEGIIISNNSGGSTTLLKLADGLSSKGYKVGIVMVKKIHNYLSIITKDSKLNNGEKKFTLYDIMEIIVVNRFLYKILIRFLSHTKFETIYKIYDFKKIDLFFSNGFLKKFLKKRINVDNMISNSWETAYVVENYKGKVTNKYQIIQYDNDPEFLFDYTKNIEYVSKTFEFSLIPICINHIDFERFKNKHPIMLKQGVDLQEFYRDLNIKKEKNLILFVVRNHYEKGAYYAIECMKILNKRRNNLKMVAFGSYTSADIPDFVDFKGFITKAQLFNYYNKASIFVFPSIAEGFGLTGLEAMACGCAVVASNNIGITYMFPIFKPCPTMSYL